MVLHTSHTYNSPHSLREQILSVPYHRFSDRILGNLRVWNRPNFPGKVPESEQEPGKIILVYNLPSQGQPLTTPKVSSWSIRNSSGTEEKYRYRNFYSGVFWSRTVKYSPLLLHFFLPSVTGLDTELLRQRVTSYSRWFRPYETEEE